MATNNATATEGVQAGITQRLTTFGDIIRMVSFYAAIFISPAIMAFLLLGGGGRETLIVTVLTVIQLIVLWVGRNHNPA